FYRKATHTILYTYNPVTFSGIYLNAGEQQNYGIEMSLHYKKGNWRFDGNYTFTDGQTKAGFDGAGNPIGKDTTYYNLYRIPKHAINLTAGWQLSKAVFLSVRTHTVS
ncbi:MAG: TonB-dependent receptor, partial [Chitinophagaceae bacterium]|nr:TonB-dependent receptor [Chitinophagaceae bacterium]